MIVFSELVTDDHTKVEPILKHTLFATCIASKKHFFIVSQNRDVC